MHGTDGFPDGWWTQERIIDSIRAYVALYGETPTSDGWHPSAVRRQGRLELVERFYSDGCWPSYYTVFRKFGSWNTAIEAAGFTPNAVGRPAGQPLPQRCVRGHLWAETARIKVRKATAKRGEYHVRLCGECHREDRAASDERRRKK